MKKRKKAKMNSKSSLDAAVAGPGQAPAHVLPQASSTPPRSRVRVRPESELRAQLESADRDTLALADRLSAVAVKYQQMYQAARTRDESGRILLDEERLARALADAGIGALAEQSLFSLALIAAADGAGSLYPEDVIAALERSSA